MKSDQGFDRAEHDSHGGARTPGDMTRPRRFRSTATTTVWAHKRGAERRIDDQMLVRARSCISTNVI